MRRSSQARGHAFPRLTVLLLLVFPLGGAPGPAHASDADEIPFNTQKIVEFHNAERAARGLGPLARDARMDAHAQQVAEDLAQRGVLEHTPSVAKTLGYPAGGQNLVFRAPTINASEAHYMWMVSDGHRRHLLNPGFTHVGVGIACSRASGRVYPVAVVDFGGHGLFPEIPPQAPVTVGAGALQGHHIVCDGTSASLAPTAPAPAPPPAPAPASPPAPKPVLPKPVAPKPAPAAPAAAPPAPAPAPPPPVVEPSPSHSLVIAAAPALSSSPSRPAKQLAQASPVADSEAVARGWTAFVAGCAGALMLAGTAGGFWFRRQLVGAVKGKPRRGST